MSGSSNKVVDDVALVSRTQHRWHGRVAVVRGDVEQCIAAHVKVARNPLSRLVGLLGRKGLAAGEGCWLEPCGAVHTFWMRFAIDVVQLSRVGEVLRIHSNLVPWRVAPAPRGTRAVLELGSGEAARLRLRIGDIVRVQS